MSELWGDKTTAQDRRIIALERWLNGLPAPVLVVVYPFVWVVARFL